MSGLPREVQFNDGEGIDETNLMDLQRYQKAHFIDGFVAQMAQLNEFDRAGPSLAEAHAVGIGGAVFADAVTPKRIRNCAGMILQRVNAAAPNGDDIRTISYFVNEDEYAQVLPVAAAGLNRYDIITTQLVELVDPALTAGDFKDGTTGALTSVTFTKLRAATATTDGATPGFLRTAGVEIAGIPAEPATPAGHIKLAAVLVDEFGASVIDPYTQLRDYRIPIGTQIDSWSANDWVINPASWTVSNNRSILRVGAGVQLAYAVPKQRNATYRFLGMRMGALRANIITLFDMVRLSIGAVVAPVPLYDFSINFPVGVFTWVEVDRALGIAPTPGPLWANGYEAGPAAGIAGVNPGGAISREALSVQFTSNLAGDTLSGGEFIWGGL